MEKNNKGTFLALLMALGFMSVVFTQCTKSTKIGGDLVNENELNFGSTDTMQLKVTTIKSTDSLKSFVYSSVPFSLSRYYLGQLSDPVFGLNTTEIIAQYGPYPGNYAEKFEGAVVDSVVLTLILDSAGYYGDNAALQSIAVARLSEPFKLDTTYYTFQDFDVEPVLLGEKNNFEPNLNKRLLVITPDSSVVDSNSAYIRIPLDNSLGNEVLGMDSIDYADAEKFAEKFKGLKIFSTSPSEGMFAVYLEASHSEIDVYYHTADKDSLVFPIHPMLGYSATDHQVKDYSGAYVEQHIGVENDSLLFLQSTGGLNLEVELPDLSSLGDVIVNKAILEFTLESLSFDDTIHYQEIPQLVLKDTTNVFIIDIAQELELGAGLNFFGGRPKLVTRDGESRMVLQMNISTLMQRVLRGTASNKVIVKSSSNADITEYGRMVLQGFSQDAKWQPKLYLNYTEL